MLASSTTQPGSDTRFMLVMTYVIMSGGGQGTARGGVETLSIHTEYIPALCSPPPLIPPHPLPTHSSTTVCAPPPPNSTVPFPPTPPPTTVCGPLLCKWLQAAKPSSRLPMDRPLSSSASN